MQKLSLLKEAVLRADAGEPVNTVSRQTGIDKKTINVHLSRYRTEKDGAFKRRQYTTDQKLEILRKYNERQLSISLLSADYGIPL